MNKVEFNFNELELGTVLGPKSPSSTPITMDYVYFGTSDDDMAEVIKTICDCIFKFAPFGVAYMIRHTDIVFATLYHMGIPGNDKSYQLIKAIICIVANEWNEINLYRLTDIKSNPLDIFYTIDYADGIRVYSSSVNKDNKRKFMLKCSNVDEYYYIKAMNEYTCSTGWDVSFKLYKMYLIDTDDDHNEREPILEGTYNSAKCEFSCFGMRFHSCIKEEGEYVVADLDKYGLPFSAQSIAVLMAKIYKFKTSMQAYDESYCDEWTLGMYMDGTINMNMKGYLDKEEDTEE